MRCVPLVAAAVCPHPPLAVPELAAGAAAELDDLRTACDEAVARLARAKPRMLCVVGADDTTGEYSFPFRGSFSPWGVPLEVRLGAGSPEPTLPLSLLMGLWWVRRAFRVDGSVGYRMLGVDRAASAGDCARWGRIISSTSRWALLVVGDGSACRGIKSPGYHDPRADPFDAAVAAALGTADLDTLLAVDPVEAAELRAEGRASWQVLAGAAAASGTGWRADLLYDQAPYGVGYFVASWTPA